MTNEELAILAQNGHKASRLALWDSIQGLFYKKAAVYYLSNAELCTSHGVELDDLRQISYMAFLDAVKAYDPESGFLFSTFINYPFQNAVNSLLGLRTERQANEPLNRAASLDKPIETADGDSSTLMDMIPDTASMDFLEELDRDSEAWFIRKVVDELKEPFQSVIRLHFFEGRTLQEIGEEMGVTAERVRQLKYKALRKLRQNKQLRQMYRNAKTHDIMTWASRWEYSPECYALVQHLRKKELSYGYRQAAMYAARERWIRMQEQQEVRNYFASKP